MIIRKFQAGFVSLVLVLYMGTWAQIPANISFDKMFDFSFTNPLWFGEIPGLRGHFMVLEKGGVAYRLEPGPGGYEKKVFLTIDVRTSDTEMGLLGLAFHPGFPENKRYFINYNPPGSRKTVVAERTASGNLKHDSGAPEKRILQVKQPYGNHNGGCIVFGPDGYLYIGMGDGGAAGDPLRSGQDLKTLLGAILRIDVDRGSVIGSYTVPKDNPFMGRAKVKNELWAYGLRNPWRFSFDALTGELWYGDVGQFRFEEVGIAEKGDNMGWAIREGYSCFSRGFFKTCTAEGLTPPIVDLKRQDAKSITGGYVFRGNPKSKFYGVYIFGDFATRKVWGLKQEDRRPIEFRQIGIAPSSISSFGTDSRGNLYAVGYNDGNIYKIRHEELELSAHVSGPPIHPIAGSP